MSSSPRLARLWSPASRRLARVLSLLLVGFSAVGCYGRFALTRHVYEVNRDVSSNEFHQTLAFWVLTLCFVYPAVIVADTAFLNALEFWGEGPASAPGDRAQSLPPDRPRAWLESRPDGAAASRPFTDRLR